MLVPMNWLKEFVNITISPEALSEVLVSRGFEIEGIHYLNESIVNVFSCKILEIKEHPNTNALHVCKVLVNDNKIKQIVTNSNTLNVDDIVPVALDSSKLATGTVIKASEIRSIKSDGMFCSGADLGLTSDDYPGASADSILKFETGVDPGINVNEILGLNDAVLDIGITANRGDANSIYGIAREVSSALKIDLKPLLINYNETVDHISNHITLKNEEPKLCSRYVAKLVKNVRIERSPRLVIERLRAVGIKPINNIVDITNYILIELGQPMHAFDLKRVNGNIVVRCAEDQERIKALDGKEYQLKTNHLVIANAHDPMAIAGVMGGADYSISNDTTDIILESAAFAKDSVRQTSQDLGLRSESSARFEKGIDYYSQMAGIERALTLITGQKIGDVAFGVLDTQPIPLYEREIEFLPKTICNILGITIPAKKMLTILNGFGFVQRECDNQIFIKVPLYRDDVTNLHDLAEEIIRAYGYDKLVKSKKLDLNRFAVLGGKSSEQTSIEKIKSILVSNGCYEILTYSFTSPKTFELLNIPQDDSLRRVIKIKNPLGEDYSVMRTTLMHGMLKSLSTNYQRGNKAVRLFEIAKVYAPVDCEQSYPIEKNHLIIGSTDDDFYTFKKVLTELCELFKFGIAFRKANISYLHPGRAAYVIKEGTDDIIGVFGEISEDIADKFNIAKRIYVTEIDPAFLIDTKNDITYKPISKYPAVERDFAVVVKKEVESKTILDIVNASGGEYLINTYVFDVYTGNQVEEGYKSIAFNMVFQSTTRTLNDTEITDTTKNILKNLANIGAVLR
ncbi:MAG: phenylalanine--tRNA ligase subunit beta [Christensenellaceae bacterium]|jgi:phenylalanyl-tRNA synthetase beta chain|nr:phenylalanine--tRNA ligase subunit beta [Christensenellaceae bacterium]